MMLIKTPPPTLLRARFATVLDYLPSVPSVVLPNQSPSQKARAFLLLKRNTLDIHINSIWPEIVYIARDRSVQYDHLRPVGSRK